MRDALAPSLSYGQRVGNTAGASLFLALAGTIDTADFSRPQRVGLFSYGSGCCSEFFSGVVPQDAPARLGEMGIAERSTGATSSRWRTMMSCCGGQTWCALVRAMPSLKPETMPGIGTGAAGSPRLVLDSIAGYHRNYRWM